jgi:selenocysteine-specific elongation factor
MAGDWAPRAFFWILSTIPELAVDREWVHLVDFTPSPTEGLLEAIHAFQRAIAKVGLRPEGPAWLETQWDSAVAPLPEVLQWMVQSGQIVQIEEGFYIAEETYADRRRRVIQAIGEGHSSTAELRAVLDTNRRFAVAFLELLDAQHVTRRVGDARVLASSAVGEKAHAN